MRIETGYHWSPTAHRESILEHGIKTSDGVVCFGPSAAAAWSLSGGMIWRESDFDDWDLWQVNFETGDDMSLRCEGGARIYEIRIGNSIPPHRCFLITSRTQARLSPGEVKAFAKPEVLMELQPHEVKAARKQAEMAAVLLRDWSVEGNPNAVEEARTALSDALAVLRGEARDPLPLGELRRQAQVHYDMLLFPSTVYGEFTTEKL